MKTFIIYMTPDKILEIQADILYNADGGIMFYKNYVTNETVSKQELVAAFYSSQIVGWKLKDA